MEPRIFKPAKHRAVLHNGRDRKPPSKFEDWWAKVYVHIVIHPAWRHLSASAKDVMLICYAKAGNAASKGIKDSEGRPKFTFAFSEAEKVLKMPSPTFSRTLSELQEKGFIGVSCYGGILLGKGRPAEYHLTDRWKEWEPPPRDTTNITKARGCRKKE